MNLDGSGKRVITANFDRAVTNPVWAADGRSVYVLYDDHGSNRVARVGLDGSVHDVATGITAGALDRPYSGGEFSVSRNGIVAVTTGDNLHPSDVGLATSGSVRKFTHLNQQLEAKVLGQPQKLPVTSSYDQRPIDAWMITPPDFDPAKKYR
jgi:dipeptidyl aminopeptidase/acylaminoacyl peptidase